jgi:hypothetical protein
MRLLLTIPHYASPDPTEAGAGRVHCSLAADLGPRVAGLAACLTALHQLFSPSACFIDHGRRVARSFDPAVPRALDVVVCTTRGRHLLDRLPVEARYYSHHPTNAEPPLLGFECHTVLSDRLGGYDYYGYLEDDLILHDPWFFLKLSWFNRHAGDDKLLQPNRYEAGLNFLVPKVYVDGDLAERVTAPFQDVHDSGPLAGEVLGVPVRFGRALNPHSGCFFLNARQMEHWVRQPHFSDRDSRFIGPLETAASLGVLRTFRVYRPAPANADFLEIQHFGTGYLERLCAPPGKEK